MKKTTKLLTLFGLIGALFVGSLNDARGLEVEAVNSHLDKVDGDLNPAIKIKVNNTSNWTPEPLKMTHVHAFDAVVDEGAEYNDTVWPGIPLDEFGEYVFPEFVQKISIVLVGYQESNLKQSADIEELKRGLHTFTIDGSGQGEPWKLNYNKVTTDYYGPEKFVVQPQRLDGIDANHTRIWLARGAFYDLESKPVLEVNNKLYEASDYVAENDTLPAIEQYWFAYYDVPLLDLIGNEIKFHRLKPDHTEIWNTTANGLVYQEGDSSKLFVIGEWLEGGANPNLSHGLITSRIGASFFAKVLEGYLTCSPSLDNGYGSFAALDTNFLPRDGEIWNMEGELGNVEITDYSGVGLDGYGVPRGVGVQVNAYEKYSALQSMYNANISSVAYPSKDKVSHNKLVAVIIIAVAGITILAGLYTYRKGRNQYV